MVKYDLFGVRSALQRGFDLASPSAKRAATRFVEKAAKLLEEKIDPELHEWLRDDDVADVALALAVRGEAREHNIESALYRAEWHAVFRRELAESRQ